MKAKNKLRNRILRSIRLAALTGAVTMFSTAAFAAVANDTLPTGGKFMGTSNGTIMSANGVMTVNQQTASAAVKWDTFNVGANATVNFNYQGAQSGSYNILNYSANAGMASEIYGRMKAGANANVWLVNPNGVIIGKGAQIDVGHMHLVAHKLADADLNDYANGVINNPTSRGEHTAAELMSMGNMYVNSISFDGNRVVLDADKLYTYAGEKVELGQKGALGTDGLVHNVTAAQMQAKIEEVNNNTALTDEQKRQTINEWVDSQATVGQVFIGENGMMKAVTGSGSVSNNTGSFASAADSNWSGDTVYGGNYLTVSHHAKELVVGYTAYDEDMKPAHNEDAKGTYENSANWRAIYTTLADHKLENGQVVMKTNSERVGFAWVEDSTQLERIGEGQKVLSRDFALKDGIAAVNTKEMNDGKGFNPIGDDLNSPDPSDPNHHGIAFTGKFDGLSYDIYGLTINRPDTNDVGLFGHVGDGAVIRNVSLVSGAIVGNNNVGGVVGHAQAGTGAGAKGITIENVKNSARVLGVNNVGGIVGKAEGNPDAEVKIINADNVALIRGNVNVGGIVGDMTYTAITGETFNTGAVKGIVNYKDDSRYNTLKDSAEKLTEATYQIGIGTSKTILGNGDVIAVNKVPGVESGSGSETLRIESVTRNGVALEVAFDELQTNDVIIGYINQAKCRFTKRDDGTFDMFNMSDPVNGTRPCKNLVLTSSAGHIKDTNAHNVGGIAGNVVHSTIGNTGNGSEQIINDSATKTKTTITKNSAGDIVKVVEANDASITADSTVTNKIDAFRIYNDVEIKAAHTLGGIAGAMSNSTIQNVYNNGEVLAEGYTTDYYYYQSSTIVNRDGYSNKTDFTNTLKENLVTLNNTYILNNLIKDSDWNNGRYLKQSIAVANAGGIVGVANGNSNSVTQIKNVQNYGDVSSKTATMDLAVVSYDSESKHKVLENKTTTYSLAGNVGGIVGKATSGNVNENNAHNAVTSIDSTGTPGVVIDYATNKENHVLGANNVGGIAGYGLNVAITNSVNEGGDISMTGARNANQQNNVIGNYGAIYDNAGNLIADNRMWDGGFSFEQTRQTIIQSNQLVTYLTGNAGGVIGYMFGDDSYVENSRNRGYVHTQDLEADGVRRITNEAVNIGGIAGKVDRSATLAWDTSTKDFNADTRTAIKASSNEGTVSGFSAIGGIVGQMYHGEIMTSKNLGNIKTSFAQNAHNDQANMGGIVGDVPAFQDALTPDKTTAASIKIYDCFNEGIIGDPTFQTYGRHVGGIVGRLRGDISKVYNAGDMYTGSDNIGGIVGYQQTGSLENVYNRGNLTNIYETDTKDVKMGGIAGYVQAGNINTAYNLGVIRSFLDTKGTNKEHNVGGIVGSGAQNCTTNVYSTGEIYAAYSTINASGDTVWNKVSTNVRAIIGDKGAPTGNNYVIKAANTDLWSINYASNNTTGTSHTIEYKDRYDINKYEGLDVHQITTDTVIKRTDDKFRMYLYDAADGVNVTYNGSGADKTASVLKGDVTYTRVEGTENKYENDSTTITVVGTMPILNKYVPYVYGGYDKDTAGYLGSKIGDEVKYIQVGTEYNPLQLNVVMNTPTSGTPTLDINYAEAEMARSAHIYVQNGNINLHNVNDKDFFMAGIYVALNGDVTISGSADRLNLSSNTAVYGNNVKIINESGSIENNAAIYALNGTATIKGKGINSYGPIVALGKDDSTGTVVRGVSASGSATKDPYSTDGLTEEQIQALKNKIYNPKIQLNNKGVDLYGVTVNNPTTANGNIEISTVVNGVASGDVNLYLGNNKLGLLSTEGSLNITGKNVYIDSDIKMNVVSHVDPGNITIKGDDIILDFSNMGATYTGSDKNQAEMLHTFVENFSGAGKGSISFQTLDGKATEAKMLLDYFDGNKLNLHKYDYDYGDSVRGLNEKLGNMNVYNGESSTAKVGQQLGYVWIANAEQLHNIQTAYVAASSEDRDKILSINYALKNSIDASEMTDFVSIGTGSTNGYTGTFDGRGYNLNSLSPNGSTGLFDTIGATGTVKNLNINASRLTGETTRVGLVAGTNKGIIENVNTFGNTVKDVDQPEGTSTPVFIGGLVGLNEEMGVIVNSQTEDIVYSDSSNFQVDVGGIAGMNAGILYQVTGKSDVSVADGGATSLGGVAGVNVGYMKDAVSVGVTAGLYDKPGIQGKPDTYLGADNVGGIAGENRTKFLTADTGASGKATQENTYTIVSGSNGELTFTINNGTSYTRTTGANAQQVAVKASANGGTIADAYNDSHVKGWSNTGGVIGKNFGVNESTTYGNLEMVAAASAYYVANAGDVIAGDNAGGLAGVNNGAIKGSNIKVDDGGTYVDAVVVTDNLGNKFTFKVADGSLLSKVNKEGAAIADTDPIVAAAKDFYTTFIVDKEKELGQTIYGRNSGKITAKSGMINDADNSKTTTGTNVGGLIGISGANADVDHLLNGKAASVYGKVNVGGLIGLNQGILQNSTNLMQNNDIAGAINVGGIVGENSGIIAKIENTNKYNITVNKDYVNLEDGTLKEEIVYDGITYAAGSDHASYFGGILGHNAKVGTVLSEGVVADVINTANVTIEHPANYVGGVMGKNDGTIGRDGMTYTDKAGVIHTIDGYLRNKGAVGVINGSNKGDFVGGVIGQNNSAISNVDITNDIEGTVYGYNYVGGIIGQNNASVEGGRDIKGNFYKYDVYNNGQVTGTTNVGGLIGDNAAGSTIRLAYNTGVVKGTTDVGGIVGSNEGTVDQVFNSTSIYNVEGKTWEQYNTEHASEPGFVPVVQGVSGTTNVGGLVGTNSGTIINAYNDGLVVGKDALDSDSNTITASNIGAVLGNNEDGGTLEKSWANVVYDDAKYNVTIKLVGANSGTLKNNYSVSNDDENDAGKIIKLSVEELSIASKYAALGTEEWAFYNNASTPLLKNFLTKAYFVPADGYENAFTYNGKEQGAVVEVKNGHVLVYTLVKNTDGTTTKGTAPIGEIFAADATGDHSLKDFLMTRNANGNETEYEPLDGPQLINGKTDGIDANRYSLLYSNQINTYYNQDVRNSDGVKERVVNPNMLGYEFFEAKLNTKENATDPSTATISPSDPSVPGYDPTLPKYDPTKPIYDPGIPDYLPDGTINPAKEQPNAVKPEDDNPRIPTNDDFIPTYKTPTYDINRVVLNATGNTVERVYGTTSWNTNPGYSVTLNNNTVDNEAAQIAALINMSTPKLDGTLAQAHADDESLADGTVDGKTTNAAGGAYKWYSTISVNDFTNLTDEQKELLKNYTFVETNKNDFDDSKTLQQTLGVNDSGVVADRAEGVAKINRAQLDVYMNNFAVVYGSDSSSKIYTWDETNNKYVIDNEKTVSVAEMLLTQGVTNHIVNGDTLAGIITITPDDAAFTGGKTNDVGGGHAGGGKYLLSGATNNLQADKTDTATGQKGISNDGNYDVNIYYGTVDVIPKKLDVTANTVYRDYGDANFVGTTYSDSKDKYVNISGFVDETEATNLNKEIGWNRTSDGALNKAEGQTQTANAGNNYQWVGTLTLDNSFLKNYTFGNEGETRRTELENITGVSIVNKRDIKIGVADLNMMYGATVSYDGHDTLKHSEEYLDNGKMVYTEAVDKAYSFETKGGTQTYNGDTLAGILDLNGVKWTNNGLKTGADAYGGFETKDVNADIAIGSRPSEKDYKLTASKDGGPEAFLTDAAKNNYNVTVVETGNVTVEYALLTAQGEDVYRYYGDDKNTAYHLVNGKLTAVAGTTEDPIYHSSDISGWAYNEETTVGSQVTVTSSLGATPSDFAIAANDKTNNVGVYVWENGSWTVTSNDSTALGTTLTNYRFWNPETKLISEFSGTEMTIAIGANSYVLPKLVEIDLKNQNVVYGDSAAAKIDEYRSNNAINNGLIKAGTGFVNGEKLADVISDATYKYNVAPNKGYTDATGDGKTNNVGEYENSIGLNTTKIGQISDTDALHLGKSIKDQNGNVINVDSNGRYIYNTFAGTAVPNVDNNYVVVVKEGTVTVTPKEVTIDRLASSVQYGTNIGTDYTKLESVTGGTITGLVYGETVGVALTDKRIVNGTNGYLDSLNSTDNRGTADVLLDSDYNPTAYNNALKATATLEGTASKNYVIAGTDNAKTTTITGDLTITRANLVIDLNTFKVLYGDTKDKTTINDNYTRNDGKIISAEELVIKNPVGLTNGDSDINNIIKITETNNGAFTDRGGYQGTVGVSANNELYAKTTDMLIQSTDTNGNVIGGKTQNYEVIINKGSVDVLAKKVLVVDPGKDIPDQPDPTDPTVKPFDPTKDDPKVKFDPDAVYIKANDVERTYGNADNKYVTNPDGTTTPVDYQITVSGLAAWEGGTKTINTYDSDGGLKDTTSTSDANTATNPTYKWDKTINSGTEANDIAGLGINYKFNNTDATSITVEGQSKVNRAQLTIKLKDKTDIIYGTTQENITYADPSMHDSGNTYQTNVGTDAKKHMDAGLAAQDAGKTWADLFEYADKNTGYNDNGTGKDAYTNGVQNTYYHNAGNVADSGQFKIVPVGSEGETKATGISSDGNYDVTILSGIVKFNRRSLNDSNFSGSDVTRTYGDTTPNGDYHATITSGLAPWDTGKDVDNLGVKDITDIGLDGTDPTKTNNVGNFSWDGKLDDSKLPSWILDNYELPAEVNINGGSNVTKAKLLVQIGNTSTAYGTPFNPSTYDFTVQGATNGDKPSDIKAQVDAQKGDYVNNQAFDGPEKWTGEPGHYVGDLLFSNMTGIDLKNYSVSVLPGNVDIGDKPAITPDEFGTVEDLFPWLHRTTTDHGFSWGKQEHWRERKAEVNFVHGGADFFYDLHERQEIDRQKTAALTDATHEHIEVDKQNHIYIVDDLGNTSKEEDKNTEAKSEKN